mgnify:CR=1 FL=1
MLPSKLSSAVRLLIACFDLQASVREAAVNALRAMSQNKEAAETVSRLCIVGEAIEWVWVKRSQHVREAHCMSILIFAGDGGLGRGTGAVHTRHIK